MWSLLFAALVLFQGGDGPAPQGGVPTAVTGGVTEAKSPAGAGAKTAAPAAVAKTESPTAAERPSADAEVSTQGKTFSDWVKEVSGSGAMGLMLRGGIFMWPILLMGIVAFGVIIERYRSLKMLTTQSGALREEVRGLLQNDRVEEALAACERESGPVAAILGAGIRKFLLLRTLGYDAGRIEEQVVKAMDDYSVHVLSALEKHLPTLATVSSAAPMVGFLGTVSGMITGFDDIVASIGKKNIVEAAAAGIGEALLTTALGLIVGIPAYVAFNYFSSVINQFVVEVEESATELIEIVTLQLALEQRAKTGT